MQIVTLRQLNVAAIVVLFLACGNSSRTEPDQPVSGDSGRNVLTDSNRNGTAQPVDSFRRGRILTSVLCKADASQSYALYIPIASGAQTLPVVFLFDPHGSGQLPVTKYRSLADEYGFILVGSNNSRNGNDWATSEKIWATLVTDVQLRVAIDNRRIYVCGFSGGAKVACFAALRHGEIKGVIANGAALPDVASAGNFNFTYTGVTGEGDMNMTDLVTLNAELDKGSTRHRIIYFDGKHEWAPPEAMSIAFAGLHLDAMNQHAIPVNPDFLTRYIDASKKRVTAFVEAKRYLNAMRECTLSQQMLKGFGDASGWFSQQQQLLTANPAYQQQQNETQQLLTQEDARKQEFSDHFQSLDMKYWNTTIGNLETAAKGKSSIAAMNQRLLAFLSLAFYSISNQLIQARRDGDALPFVTLYKRADPTNTEAWYFSAILNARSNDGAAAQQDLLHAASLGFSDGARMRSQPEFRQPQINLPVVEARMK